MSAEPIFDELRAALATDSAEPPRPRRWERWVRIGLALLAGAAAALAHPPFGLLIGLLGYPLLMLLCERSGTVRGAFWMGWLAGFAYFVIGCWWVAEAFLVDPSQAWMAPFAASLLPAFIALFWAAPCALYRRFAPPGASRALVFAALFCLFEWLRGHVLTGFPWNLAGATWKAGSAGSQGAALVGVYALGLITVGSVSAFAPLVVALRDRHRLKGAVGMAMAGAVVLTTLQIYGLVRLDHARAAPGQTLVRIVQADVKQAAKWSPEAYRSIVDRYVNLTARSGAGVPDVIIWPEGALPALANDVFAPGSPDATAMARALQPGQTLMLGLGRGEADAAAPGGARYYNSLFALTDDGGPGLRVAAVYDKHRLVPFGEYLPLGGLLTRLGVRRLVHAPSDFTAGPYPQPIDLPNAPRVQPLICYESLYPGFTEGARGRPGWIVNISNDSWFGVTSGPLQHLNLASYRAIETGVAVVRATPTGVSALIDPYGRILHGQRLDPGESGVIDARLPEPAPITLFGRVREIPYWTLLLLGLACAAPWRRWLARGRRPTDRGSAQDNLSDI